MGYIFFLYICNTEQLKAKTMFRLMQRSLLLFVLFLLVRYSCASTTLTYDGIVYHKYSDHVTVGGPVSKSLITTAQIREIVFGMYVQYIGAAAFENCASMKEITLPSKLLYISEQAFTNCSRLRSIVLPNTMEKLTLRRFLAVAI